MGRIWSFLASFILFVAIYILYKNGYYNSIDIWCNHLSTTLHSIELNSIITKISTLNNPPVVLIFVLIITFIYRKYKRLIVSIWISIVGSAISASIVKALVNRARPDNRLLDFSSSSFPSWHATTAMGVSFAIYLIAVSTLKNSKIKLLFILLSSIWFITIGLSRVYLNVHWCSDVLAGWLLGATLGFIGVWIYKIDSNSTFSIKS